MEDVRAGAGGRPAAFLASRPLPDFSAEAPTPVASFTRWRYPPSVAEAQLKVGEPSLGHCSRTRPGGDLALSSPARGRQRCHPRHPLQPSAGSDAAGSLSAKRSESQNCHLGREDFAKNFPISETTSTFIMQSLLASRRLRTSLYLSQVLSHFAE